MNRPAVAAVEVPAAPAHLSDEAGRLWAAVTGEYLLEPHTLAILERACESLDRLRQAQAAIADLGLTVEGRQGPRLNPAVGVEATSRAAFLRAVKDLGLDVELVSNQARTAAAREVRWVR